MSNLTLPWAQLETITSPSVTGCLANDPDPPSGYNLLSRSSRESKAPPFLQAFLQAKKTLLPQLLLIGVILWNLHQL